MYLGFGLSRWHLQLDQSAAGALTLCLIVNETQKQELLSSLTNQIPEQIFTHRINQDCELLLDVGVAVWQSQNFHTIPVLLGSGANTTFIDATVAECLGLPLVALSTPICKFNVNSSCNSAGDITHSTTITMEYLGHRKELTTEVMNLGKNSLILGYLWLKKHNLSMDWEKGIVKFNQCPHSCLMLQNRA